MDIKKFFVITMTGLGSSIILANPTPPYTQKSSFSNLKGDDTGVYAEGLVGYNRYDFSDGYSDSLAPGTSPGFSQRQWNHGTGHWIFGLTVGYQFHRYFSAEAGGLYTLRAKYSYVFTGIGSTKTTITVRPWYAYLAGKLSILLCDKISLFTKLGAGYQRTKITGDPDARGNQGKWGPMFGAGLAYHFTSGFYINGQWLRFTGKIKNARLDNTAPNIFLLGMGYKFAM